MLLPVVCVPFRRRESWPCVRGVVAALALLMLSAVFDPAPARAQNVTAQTANEKNFNPFEPCPKCQLLVGGSYKTEIDTLDATRLNFSYLLAARFDLGASGSLFEIAARHWSNAYIKRPNIGENFLTLSFSY